MAQRLLADNVVRATGRAKFSHESICPMLRANHARH
jgi:hypothetical protein